MARFSQRMKKKRYSYLIKDQNNHCYICNSTFSPTVPPEFDHLNNNHNDSRPENTGLLCHTCNVKKIRNPEYQVIGHERMLRNEKQMYMCERMIADTGTTEQLTSCQAISQTNMQITKQFLIEHTINAQTIELKDSVNAIVNLCQDNNKTGSQSAVYRYIEILTNKINGKYTLSTNSEGKTVIRRRTEN